MNRQRVSSTNVASIGYDAAARILEVEFVKGGIYQYLGVPESTYRELMAAQSVGRYLMQRVRDRFPCNQVA